ncbi:MAG: RDD family protein, partial [Phycisphaerae bacterium]
MWDALLAVEEVVVVGTDLCVGEVPCARQALAAARHFRFPPAMRHAQQVWLAGLCGLYFVFCWTRSGQTLGMKTWGLEVRNAHGGRLNVRRAAARYVLALAGLLAAGAGFFWALFDRDHQFLHDRLLGTRIV